MSEDFKTYAQLHAELAAFKAERTALRECLVAVSRLDYLNEHNALAERVRAVLAKGTDKESWPWPPRQGEGQ